MRILRMRFLEQFIFSLNYGSIGLNDTGIQGAFAPTEVLRTQGWAEKVENGG